MSVELEFGRSRASLGKNLGPSRGKAILGATVLLASLTASPCIAGGAPSTSSTDVRVLWEYRGIPEGMSLYESAKDKEPELWSMGAVRSLKEAPVSDLIPGSVLRMRRGQSRSFVLVYHNSSAKTVEFFAAPHHVAPPEASLGFNFDCLCVNHVYRAEPGEYWYRAVRLTLDPQFEGRRLDVSHALVRYAGKTPRR